MIWFMLLLIVVTGIFINSFRLFLLGLLVMATIALPQVVLPTLAGLLWWVVKSNLKCLAANHRLYRNDMAVALPTQIQPSFSPRKLL